MYIVFNNLFFQIVMTRQKAPGHRVPASRPTCLTPVHQPKVQQVLGHEEEGQDSPRTRPGDRWVGDVGAGSGDRRKTV